MAEAADQNTYKGIAANLRPLPVDVVKEMKADDYEKRFNIKLSSEGRSQFSRTRADVVRKGGLSAPRGGGASKERPRWKPNDILYTYELNGMDDKTKAAVRGLMPEMLEGALKALGLAPIPAVAFKVVEVLDEKPALELRVK